MRKSGHIQADTGGKQALAYLEQSMEGGWCYHVSKDISAKIFINLLGKVSIKPQTQGQFATIENSFSLTSLGIH